MSDKKPPRTRKAARQPELESLLKVSQVSRATGVSTSAINYYVRIGLLPPPVKTHKNMAYYDPSYIQMINYVRRLQLQKHLPLEQIKEIMSKKIKIWRDMSGSPNLVSEDAVAEGMEESPSRKDARERIMETGSRLFSQQGYYATAEEDIIEQAGITAGEFYEHYSGKEDLLLDLAEEGVRVFRSRVSEEIASVPDMLERIRIAIPVAFQVIVENREIYTLYLEESVLADTPYERKLAQIMAWTVKDLKMTIVRGVKEGTIRQIHPDIAANAIIGQLVRLANYWMEDPLKHNMEEITREAVEFVTRALAP
ncbi:MAG: MerR family transcriptional regulator [Actinomycetota bacterium]|nr:MerR family transcriptional regulator [Actinomycetota bacterium]MDD5667822.1 MerR family transcriptional regulator [Actinomycetota bacterium]